MKTTLIAAAASLAALVALIPAPAAAQSCYDLWYERNHIYAINGYCFSTDLGKRTFAGFTCWTKNPDLTRAEQARVDAIRAEEKRRGCKVN